MLKKMLFIIILILSTSVNVFAIESTNIEIFDINKNCVVKIVETNAKIQNEAKNYLNGISGLYSKFNPIPVQGYMIKIPLEYPIKIQNQWFNAFVDEMVIIIPKQADPYLMIFDNMDRTLFLSFKGNVNIMLKKLNFVTNFY